MLPYIRMEEGLIHDLILALQFLYKDPDLALVLGAMLLELLLFDDHQHRLSAGIRANLCNYRVNGLTLKSLLEPKLL
jgi:hypothetical protein